jgi:hypothetical protein
MKQRLKENQETRTQKKKKKKKKLLEAVIPLVDFAAEAKPRGEKRKNKERIPKTKKKRKT